MFDKFTIILMKKVGTKCQKIDIKSYCIIVKKGLCYNYKNIEERIT